MDAWKAGQVDRVGATPHLGERFDHIVDPVPRLFGLMHEERIEAETPVGIAGIEEMNPSAKERLMYLQASAPLHDALIEIAFRINQAHAVTR
jgi:hypothetical protein